MNVGSFRAEGHADGDDRKLASVEDDAPRMQAKLPRGCWHRYSHGSVSPRSGDKVDGKPGLVERVDQSYPETAKVFHSALWRVAAHEYIDMIGLREVFESLPGSIRSYFVLPPGEANEIFWRRRGESEWIQQISDSGPGVGQLSTCSSMDLLTAMLALIKEAETTQDSWKHAYWVRVTNRWMATQGEKVLGSAQLLQELVDYLHRSWPRAR